MTTFSFEPATRETAKARIALQGPGGSGKTKSALRIAEGLAPGGLIGVVDTERRSALKYAPVPGRPDLGGHQFTHLPLAFCSPENLIAVVKAAEEARVQVLIIDSWSHFWAGKGGLLARVDEESKKPGHYGGSYTAWAPVNNLEQDMLDALLGFPGHVIVTMRTKNDYEMTGSKVTKIGVKTVQREGAEYEVDVVIDMVEGTGTVTKTRYEPLANQTIHHPDEHLGEVILEQLGQGVDKLQGLLDALAAEDLTVDGARELHRQADRGGLLARVVDHPRGGERGELGPIIVQIGTSLKAGAAPATPTTPPDLGEDEHAADTARSQQPTTEPATAQQMRLLHVLLKQLDLTERADVLEYVAGVIGRPVASRNELTKAEMQQLLDHMQASTQTANASAA